MHVNYIRTGAGPVLLLLHGIGSNRRSFRHQMSGLSDAFDLIAWDAPGYGGSEDPQPGFGMEDLANSAVALLDELGIQQAHVLGVSMGGVVAQMVFHRHPLRVASLILADTNAGGGALPEPERTARVRQRLDALERLGPRGMAKQRAPVLVSRDAPAELIAELIEIMSEVRPTGYCGAAIALGGTDLTPQLSSISVPVLVVHGEHDAVVPLDTGRQLAAAIPGARLEIIPNAGHVSNQEQPEVFNRGVRAFLTRDVVRRSH